MEENKYWVLVWEDNGVLYTHKEKTPFGRNEFCSMLKRKGITDIIYNYE